MQNNYSQVYFPKLSPINKIILVTVLVIFIIDSLMMKVGGVSLAPFFVLSPATFFKVPCLYTSNLPFTVSINLGVII